MINQLEGPVTRIRYDDIPRIAHTGMRAGHHLEQYGQSIWLLTRDWQTPLAATGLEPGRGGTGSDPTGDAAVTADELRDAHNLVLAALDAYETVAVDLFGLLERYRPLSERERRQAGVRVCRVRDCVICDEPAFPVLGGACVSVAIGGGADIRGRRSMPAPSTSGNVPMRSAPIGDGMTCTSSG